VSDDHAEYFDIYRLTVEMADRISARRATANAFFLTIHSALVAALGLVETSDDDGDEFGIVVTALVGIVLAAAWWLLLRSYRELNGAKFTVIQELEKGLAAAPFTREWEIVKPAEGRSALRRYAEFGLVERVVPVAYALLYVAAIVRVA
jgi:hypothetical protein